MDRNSIIAPFLYRRRKRRRNGLHWIHPIIQKKGRIRCFYTLFGELRDEANKFLKSFSNVCFIFRRDGKDCDSTIFKRSTPWTSIQTNMLELPRERPV